MTSKIHILTINTQGLGDKEKRGRFYAWVRQQKGNIILAQETHFKETMMPYIKTEWQGEVIHSFGTTKSKGVSIFIDKKINPEIINTHKDREGRLLLINVKINDNIYTIVNVYAPNDRKQRNTFYKQVKTFILNHSLGSIIIGGDWNEIQHTDDRLSKKIPKEPVNNLKLLIKELKLSDPWKLKNPKKKQFTWKRKNSGNEASRIDYFLIQKEVIDKIITSDIRPVLIKYTDHQAVSLIIDIKPIARGPGYWKLNNSLLNDSEYQNIIIKTINKHTKMKINDQLTAQTIWDLCKIEIREKSIHFGKKKKNLRKNELKELEQKLKEKLDKKANAEEIKLIEEQIEAFYVHQAKGNQIRSRAVWIEKGEKNNKYFLSLEKSRQMQKSIRKLYDEDGNTLTEQGDILNRQKRFYEKLFTTKEPNIEEINRHITSINLENTVSEDDGNKCEGLVNKEECLKSLNKMKLNKSPGSDGLTVEFYRKFWIYLKEILINSLNDAYKNKKLSDSQRTGILSLIYKKNDHCDLNNWRPITLLNVDYKILAHCLAERIKPILPKIINTDQNGFVMGRNIRYNIRLIQDIIDYTEKNKFDGSIIFLDFAKAFDSIEWEFMLSTLKHFGFKNSFLNWVSTLYNQINCLVSNNGWLSEPVNISRGIRQGCPLSALLFVITVEVMATKIRQDGNIRGIQIKPSQNRDFKISQLADDTTLFMKTKTDITKALNLIEIFGSLSGLVLNRNKSQGIKLGNNKRWIEDNYEDIDWTSESIKALGIHFGLDSEKIEKLNWENKLEKIEQLVKKWKRRKLTMIGRIQICKSLLIPKLTYVSSVLSVPKQVIKRAEKIMYGFIWDGKIEKVKRTNLCSPYENGGLKMLDLTSHITTLQCSWVKNLKTDNSLWTIIPKHYLNQYGKNLLIFSMNVKELKNLNNHVNIPTFYQDILKSWFVAGGGERGYPKTATDIANELIWGNQFIKYKNKVLIFENWITSNILRLKDMLDHQGKISENIILNKLENKNNWISQVSKIKKSIPRQWQDKLKLSDIERYQIKKNDYTIPSIKFKNMSKNISIENILNKQIYDNILQKKTMKPSAYIAWENEFPNIHKQEIEDLINKMINFTFTNINDNRIKMFRWKLLNRILANNQLLHKWKIKEDPLCNVCGVTDTYDHFFTKCRSIITFKTNINHLFEKIGYKKDMITLKNIVLGYKISYEKYDIINFLLTYIAYAIYKGYYVSEQRTINTNIETILKSEIRMIVAINKYTRTGISKLLRLACEHLGINLE